MIENLVVYNAILNAIYIVDSYEWDLISFGLGLSLKPESGWIVLGEL